MKDQSQKSRIACDSIETGSRSVLLRAQDAGEKSEGQKVGLRFLSGMLNMR